MWAREPIGFGKSWVSLSAWDIGCSGFAWRAKVDSPKSSLWLAGNGGMEKKMETAIMCYIGITIRIPKP